MRTLAVQASWAIVMATAALLPGSLTTIAVDDAPDPVPLDLTVASAGEPVSVDLVVDGQPLRVASTSSRSVTVGAGEPVTVTLADPGPDHVLASISCIEPMSGILPDPMSVDLEAGSVTLGDPDAALACHFGLDDAALARHVSLAVEAQPADPGASVDFFLEGGGIVAPTTVAAGGPRTFPVPPDDTFIAWSIEPASPWELGGLTCLDQHGRPVDMLDPTRAVEVPQGSVPERPVAILVLPGSQATCTAGLLHAPDLPGSATIRVITAPSDAATAFGFEIDGAPVTIGPGAPHLVSPSADADRLTIELPDPGPDHELGGIDCVRGDGSEPTPYDLGPPAGRVTVGLDPADTVDCVYRLFRPDPVPLDLTVASAGEPVSVDLVVDGQPLRVASTSSRSVTVGAGEPVTVTLADPGPDHVLASISCIEPMSGILPDPMSVDLEAGSVTLGDPDAALACHFGLDDAALARHVSLAVEAQPADPGASVDFFLEGGGIVAPTTVAAGGPRTFPVPPDDTFIAWSIEPASPWELGGLTCLDQHGRPVDMLDPTRAVEVPQGSVPERPVAILVLPGSQATCTAGLLHAPDLPGSATIRVITAPSDAATAFGFEIDGAPVTIGPGAPHLVSPSADADRLTIELPDPGPDHELGGIDCVRGDGSEPTPYDLGPPAGRVTVGLDPADTVDCVYRLFRPDPVPLDLTVASAGEPVSVDLVVDGQPLRVASTSSRSVTVGAGEPVTVTLADPGPDHVLASISCIEPMSGILPDPMSVDLEAGSVTLGDPDAALACHFGLDDAALARHVSLAVEAQPADPGASVDFFLEGGGIVAPTTVAAGGPRTFPVPPDDTFIAWSIEPASPWELGGLTCLDQHGRPVDMLDPTRAVEVPQGSVPERPVAILVLPGSQATCTAGLLHAPDLPGSATIRVITAPSDAATAFGFEIDGAPVTIGPGAPHTLTGETGSTSTVRLVDPGPHHILTSVGCVDLVSDAQPLLSYEADLGGALVSFGVDADRDIICTFSLTRPPGSATVTVVAEPEDPEAEFEVALNGDPVTVVAGEPLVVSGLAGEAFTAQLLDPGPGYELVDITCRLLELDGEPIYSADATTRTLRLEFFPRDRMACTFAIRELRATVVAAVVTEPPFTEGEVTLMLGPDTVSLGHGELATDDSATPGRYHIVLLPTEEFALRGVDCADADGGAVDFVPTQEPQSITLAPVADSTTTCTFTIVPTVATVRTTIDAGPEPVEATFTLQLPGGDVELMPGDITTDDAARADLYRMALLPDRAFRLLDIVCLPEGGEEDDRLPAETDLEAWTIALAPGIGAVIDCTFLLEARLATVRTTIDAGPEPVEATFTLQLPGGDVELMPGDITTDDAARADLYRMALLPDRAFRLLDIVCLPEGGEEDDRLPAETDLEASTIALAPGIGAVIDCTFLLEARLATVRTTIDAGPEPVEATFTLQLPGGDVELMPGDITTDDAARADLYRMALLPDRAFRLLDIVCLPEGGDEDDRLPAETDLEAWTIALAPGIGAVIDCTFLLEANDEDGGSTRGGAPVSLLPKSGPWRATNLPTTVRCAGQGIRLERTVDRGRIQVRDGGRTIIARGIAQGQRSPIRLRLVDAEAATYRGRIRLNAAGGSLTLTFDMRVITPERIEAVLTGRANFGGQSCRITRDAELSYIGG